MQSKFLYRASLSVTKANMTTVAPDGGFWGWMAVFACFMGNLIGDGVMYRSGERE